jgi:hypothetical protein
VFRTFQNILAHGGFGLWSQIKGETEGKTKASLLFSVFCCLFSSFAFSQIFLNQGEMKHDHTIIQDRLDED